MAIELITGVGETNHVSSNDFRAFNRAIFGQQRYILKDADNMDVVVSAVTGDISIATGSCVWSGMHIRIASVEKLKYIVPVSTQRINIYLHYTKSVETFVESVEFVVLQGSEATPIVNELDDDTIEAYTLFYSFDATSTAISNINKAFDFVMSQSDIVDEVNKSIANASETVVLFDGDIVPGTIHLSESLENFEYIIFEAKRDYAFNVTLFSDYIKEDFAVSIVGNAKWGNMNNIFVVIENIFASKVSGTELKIKYTSVTYIDVTVNSSYGSQGVVLPVRIIGRGRKHHG